MRKQRELEKIKHDILEIKRRIGNKGYFNRENTDDMESLIAYMKRIYSSYNISKHYIKKIVFKYLDREFLEKYEY